MEVRRLAAGGFDLHVVADLFGEQVPVVGGEDDRLDPEVAQTRTPRRRSFSTPSIWQPGLGDVVLLAEFVDLLRGDQHQLGAWMPSWTFFDGLGSRSSSLASKTGTPAWLLRNAIGPCGP